jgi:hypothetical protein
MKKKLPRIVSATPVLHGVLKITWDDGYTGLVDMRPILARGKVFTPLQDPRTFDKVQVSEFGHSIEWPVEGDGPQLDFASNTLRDKAEKQAALIALAS